MAPGKGGAERFWCKVLMRYGIFSDVHSNLEALDAVVEAYKKESIDKYFCIGDVVGYGANPRECIERVSRFVTLTVAGNHDRGSVNLFPLSYFNPLAAEALLWTNRQLDSGCAYFLESLKLVYQDSDFTLTHGTLDEPQQFNYMLDNNTAGKTFRLLDTDICFVGHTHMAGIFQKDKNGNVTYLRKPTLSIEEANTYIVNAGSVGQPRDGNNKAAFCIYDTALKTVEIKRVPYDIAKTRKKIIDAGLPQYLGDRLSSGR
jgi:predicted phosphodiesterase